MPRCRVCEAGEMAQFHGPKMPMFWICGGCGSLQNEERFDRSSLSGVDIYGKTAGYPQFCLTLGQRLFRSSPLIRHMSPGRMFQVEVNDGYLAATWIHRGWVVDGSSLSSISASRASKLGVNVIVSMPSELRDLGGARYDAVISEMGYCRFPSPLWEISEPLSNLRVGGALLIHGPNPASGEILTGNHPHLSLMNHTIPHPDEIVGFCGERGMVLIDRRDEGADVMLLFVKVS